MMEIILIGIVAFIGGAHTGAALIMNRLHKHITGKPMTYEEWFNTLEALMKKPSN